MMTTLIRHPAFPTVSNIFREMDNLLNARFFGCDCAWPAVDMRETDDSVIVEMDLPGVRAGDVGVTFDDGVLVIEGERKLEEMNGAARRERMSGKFRRSFRFSLPIDAENIKAVIEHGVLTVTLPKAENARPRKIEVKAA